MFEYIYFLQYVKIEKKNERKNQWHTCSIRASTWIQVRSGGQAANARAADVVGRAM